MRKRGHFSPAVRGGDHEGGQYRGRSQGHFYKIARRPVPFPEMRQWGRFREAEKAKGPVFFDSSLLDTVTEVVREYGRGRHGAHPVAHGSAPGTERLKIRAIEKDTGEWIEESDSYAHGGGRLPEAIQREMWEPSEEMRERIRSVCLDAETVLEEVNEAK